MEQILYVGFDMCKDEHDTPILTVGRQKPSSDGKFYVEILNTVFGDEAVMLYDALIGAHRNKEEVL